MNEPGPADLDMTVKLTLPTIEPYQHAADATMQFAAITADQPPPPVQVPAAVNVPAAVGAGPPPAMPMAGYGLPVSPAVGYGPPVYAYHPAYGSPGPEHAAPAYHYPPSPPAPQKNVAMSFLLAFTGTLAACMLTVTLVLLLR